MELVYVYMRKRQAAKESCFIFLLSLAYYELKKANYLHIYHVQQKNTIHYRPYTWTANNIISSFGDTL